MITERIEAEISEAAWNRQEMTELKREVLLEATKKLAQLYEAMTALASAFGINNKSPEWHTLAAEKRDNLVRMPDDFSNARHDFSNAAALVSVRCWPQLNRLMAEAHRRKFDAIVVWKIDASADH